MQQSELQDSHAEYRPDCRGRHPLHERSHAGGGLCAHPLWSAYRPLCMAHGDARGRTVPTLPSADPQGAHDTGFTFETAGATRRGPSANGIWGWTGHPSRAIPGDWEFGTPVRRSSKRLNTRVDLSKPFRNGPLDLGFGCVLRNSG